MNPKEATVLVGRIFSRYPSASPDRGMLAAWTDELVYRFGFEDAENVTLLTLAYCRANPSLFAPSLDVLCHWVRDRFLERDRERRIAERRAQARLLPAPEKRLESFRGGLAELFRKIGADKIGRPMTDA